MNYTDDQLKAALAKMLPDVVEWKHQDLFWRYIFNEGISNTEVLDTELLHFCWLVERDLNPEQKLDYIEMLGRGEDEESFYPTIALSSDWRWRVDALAKVKSIDIV